MWCYFNNFPFSWVEWITLEPLGLWAWLRTVDCITESTVSTSLLLGNLPASSWQLVKKEDSRFLYMSSEMQEKVLESRHLLISSNQKLLWREKTVWALMKTELHQNILLVKNHEFLGGVHNYQNKVNVMHICFKRARREFLISKPQLCP